MQRERVVFLLGRPDEPTDGVEDYCTYLGRALERRGVRSEITRMRWDTLGWVRALRTLWVRAEEWQQACVLVQYTALAWSRRGFPVGFPGVVALLRLRRAKCVVIFHDPSGFPGSRPIDHLRRRVQQTSMALAARFAHRSVVTVPLDRLPWQARGTVFIPVGANLPQPAFEPALSSLKTVAVYGVTGGSQTLAEVDAVAHAVNTAASRLAGDGKCLRLVVFGRGAEQAGPLLRARVASAEVEVRGVLSPEEVARTLAGASVQLFVRGGISTRRASALAAVACGVPIVAYSGPETAPPVTEAGVLLVPPEDRNGLAQALVRVLTDDSLREELAARSRAAHERWFSWDAIADRMLEVLRGLV